ncbi:DUF6985 domain-containing protein [Oliverpabstia intestinalis]|uniref:DUF6985 domain-containing protein n=1 Tax=Oliverpabstia intestinalis TaxID=2606633 RepID=UPI003F8A93C5
MSKVKTTIWGREFELPVIVKQFKGKDVTEIQEDAVDQLERNMVIFDSAESEVEKYILKNGLKENGISEVDNIFKYVMPKSISVPKAKKRVVALMCNYKFDMEHGIAVIFEDEKFKKVGPQDLVL